MPEHIPALDGIRGLAICLVLTRHCLSQPLEASAHPGNWQYAVYYWTKMMWCGVDLFFVLSGFLIAKVVLENQNSPRLFRAFYARRASRILPLYYTVVAAMLLARRWVPPGAAWDWLFDGQYPWQSYATLTQNFAMGTTGLAGGNALAVSWSLAIEEQFYIVLPLVIRFLPARWLPWLFAAGVPLACFLRAYWNDARSYYLAPARADDLLLGCLLAWICLRPKAYAWLQRQGVLLTVLLAVLGAGLLGINRFPEHYGQWVYTWLALFFGVLILLAATQRGHLITRILEMRWLGFMGLVSYGVYLLHRPIQGAFYWATGDTAPKIYAAADLYQPVVIIGITVALAALSWFGFEKPWVTLGRKVKF